MNATIWLAAAAALGMVGLARAEEPPPLAAVALATLPVAPEIRADADRVAALIADAASVAAERPLFDGPRGVDATAALMLAVTLRESDWRPDVERCEPSGIGDHGRSLGLPQESAHWFGSTTRAEFCSDRRVQFRVMLAHMWLERAHCPGRYDEMLAGWHAGTSCGADAVSRGHAYLVGRLLDRLGIKVKRQGKAWAAE